MDLLERHSGIRLDIGGGSTPQEGFVVMDIRPLPGVDIVHDCEDIPWPLPDECVIDAIASHLVEHINPAKFGFINFMNEVWRIMKPGGKFWIATPYGASKGYYQDPTHCNPCIEATWLYFDPLEQAGEGRLYRIYEPKPWRISYLHWLPQANLEVMLIKRREDYLEEERERIARAAIPIPVS